MIFSGANYRKIQEKGDYNFFLDGSVSNTTGNAVFGFSGEGQKFQFDFLGGRIIDPSDDYTFSYNTGDFQLSGIVNDENYNYFINNEQIVASGSKNNFKVDRFFVDCTGCNLNVNNLIINGSGATTFTFQNMNQSVGDSGNFTGEIVVNDSQFGKFDIFSGEVLTPEVTGLFSIITDFSTGIESTGNLVVSGLNGIENQTPYTFEAILYTSFGQVVKTFDITGSTPFYQASLELDDLQETVESGGFPNQIKYLNYSASNILFTGDPVYATGLSLNVALSYSGGFTGQITGALTGVNILTSGTNYSNIFLPDIVVSGDGENATVTGLVADNGTLTGIKVVEGGSGYSQPPNIIIYSGVSSISIDNSGQGYFSSPVVEISGGREGGTSASATLNVSNGAVSSVSITNFGNRYTGVPTLNIIPGLSGVILTHSGSGYLSEPTVFINNGGGSGASVNALTGDPATAFSGFITGFELVSGGSGYTGVPTVLVSGGSPTISGSGNAVLSSGFSGTVNMSSGASATGVTGNYTKDFTGVFNLLTGSGGPYHNFRSGKGDVFITGEIDPAYNTSFGILLRASSVSDVNQFSLGESVIIEYTNTSAATESVSCVVDGIDGAPSISVGEATFDADSSHPATLYKAGQIASDNLSYTGENVFFRQNLTLPLGVETNIDIQVQNYNYYDSFPMIALLTVSGSGSQISTLQVTGIK